MILNSEFTHDFAEVLAVRKCCQRLTYILEGESRSLIDDRGYLVHLQGSNHVFEHLAAADRDTLQPDVLRDDAAQIDLAGDARQNANQA